MRQHHYTQQKTRRGARLSLSMITVLLFMAISIMTTSFMLETRSKRMKLERKVLLSSKINNTLINMDNIVTSVLDGNGITWSFTADLNDTFGSYIGHVSDTRAGAAVFILVKNDSRSNETTVNLPGNLTQSLLVREEGVWYNYGQFHGTPGADGFSCWDSNKDYVCQPSESTDGNNVCDWKDCRTDAPFKALCWDVDKNGNCDLILEDINNDGKCDVFDCIGGDGAGGPACWDLDFNGICNLATEDKNADNQCNVLDCKGKSGFNGINCWDLDRSGTCNVLTEDRNLDGVCNTKDCIGNDGTNGTNGFNGFDGIKGRECWDFNANYICDLLTEDVNHDGNCSTLDCIGKDGNNGISKPNGYHCWDINFDRICNPATEDFNFDGVCTVADCTGESGISGINGTSGISGVNGTNGKNGFKCWDANYNRICDLSSEDRNSDGICNETDCIGYNGYIFDIFGIAFFTSGFVTTTQNNYILNKQTFNLTIFSFYISLDSMTAGNHPTGIPAVNITGYIITYDGTNWKSYGMATDIPGPQGPSGDIGYSCWDKNLNLVCDLVTEDIDGNSACDRLDCLGKNGVNGISGANGIGGTNAYTCWDTTLDRVCNVSIEDIDGNGVCNQYDCREKNGIAGTDGINGFDCYNTDFSLTTPCTVTKDINGDGACNVTDCRGPQGPVGYNGTSCGDPNANCTANSIDRDGWCGKRDCTVPKVGWSVNEAYAIFPVPMGGWDGAVTFSRAPDDKWYGGYYIFRKTIEFRYMRLQFGLSTSFTTSNVRIKIMASPNGSILSNAKTITQLAETTITFTSNTQTEQTIDFGSVITAKCCGLWVFFRSVEGTTSSVSYYGYAPVPGTFSTSGDKFNQSPYYFTTLNISPGAVFTSISILNMQPSTFVSPLIFHLYES